MTDLSVCRIIHRFIRNSHNRMLNQFLRSFSLVTLPTSTAKLQLAEVGFAQSISRHMATLKRKADTQTSPSQGEKKPKKDASLTSFFGAPRIKAAVEPVAATFDKGKWVSGLNAEQKKLLKLEIDTLDSSWLAHLKDEITSVDFLSLKRFLQQEIDSGSKIFPPLEEVYSWSRHTPLNTVRVVILGQDPYHNHNQAHGLCFSVRPPTPAPPSLQNMFKALAKDYPSFKPPPNRGGLLTPWADQGVLLLNTCLTVRAHEANSHSNKGWEKFTQKIIDTVVRVRTRGVVFLAWGTPAQKRCAKISGMKHLVLKSVHPSPLSAMRGFFDCGHFRLANEWIEERYGKEGVIDWDLNVKKPIKAPEITKPVKTIADQSVIQKAGSTTEIATSGPQANDPVLKPKQNISQVGNDEFEGDDDGDAIEALEELAREGADFMPAETTEGKSENDKTTGGQITIDQALKNSSSSVPNDSDKEN